jgi:hypothetical protein
MDDKTNARTLGKRIIVASLDREFSRLYSNACALVEQTPVEILYDVSQPTRLASVAISSSGPCIDFSIGESVLRSAAAIEQTFGGITANLWDDPFEWTLPEYLSTPAKVKDYLAEVEATRKRAFLSFADDDCLLKHVAVPSGDTRPLVDLLLETLLSAARFQTQATVALKILFRISPPGFTI